MCLILARWLGRLWFLISEIVFSSNFQKPLVVQKVVNTFVVHQASLRPFFVWGPAWQPFHWEGQWLCIIQLKRLSSSLSSISLDRRGVDLQDVLYSCIWYLYAKQRSYSEGPIDISCPTGWILLPVAGQQSPPSSQQESSSSTWPKHTAQAHGPSTWPKHTAQAHGPNTRPKHTAQAHGPSTWWSWVLCSCHLWELRCAVCCHVEVLCITTSAVVHLTLTEHICFCLVYIIPSVPEPYSPARTRPATWNARTPSVP